MNENINNTQRDEPSQVYLGLAQSTAQYTYNAVEEG
jgi:hypothetical protein